MKRTQRAEDGLRELTFERHYLKNVPGSVLVSMGDTRVVCTVSVVPGVPGWMEGRGQGWITAEYGMLPASGGQRKPRDAARGKIDGRSQEIQRLIGRSLRAIVDRKNLGENTLWIDCDVLQADGGTRTASINGAYVALFDALKGMERQKKLFKWPLRTSVAAVSTGWVDGKPLLDLCYEEDSTAEVDLNVVMTGEGRFIEIQGTAEGPPFADEQLQQMLDLARKGIREITAFQERALKNSA
jgi:ribonuclease PH